MSKDDEYMAEINRLEAEVERLRGIVGQWENCWVGLEANFDGVTDDATDSKRLHDWTWVVEHWNIPVLHEYRRKHAAEAAKGGGSTSPNCKPGSVSSNLFSGADAGSRLWSEAANTKGGEMGSDKSDTLDAGAIAEMVRRIVGPVQPTGDHGADMRRLDNAKVLATVLQDLLEPIIDVSGRAESHEASVAAIGRECVATINMIHEATGARDEM